MYELYVTLCEKENVVPAKEKYYYNVFSTKFNLHFKQTSKDTCQTCDSLQIKIIIIAKNSLQKIILINIELK